MTKHEPGRRDDANLDQVIVETLIDASADEVWQWLRVPHLIRRWHGWDTPGLDAEIDAIYMQDAVADDATRTMDVPGVNARFSVVEHPNGVILRVTKPGVVRDATWDDIYDDVDQGWITFVQQLRFAIELHPDEPRRCSLVPGRPGSDPVASLGLPTEPGAAYVLPAPHSFRGQVWSRSRHQLGLTIDSDGTGLVILCVPPGRTPHAFVTTYAGDHDHAVQAWSELLDQRNS